MECKFLKKGLCTGCVGLAEDDWIGPQYCETYKKLLNPKGLEQCKKILGIEEKK